MTSGIRAIALSVCLLIVWLACSWQPKQAFSNDISHYYPIDDSFDWDALQLGDEEILPLEVVAGRLCLLKEPYRKNSRRLDEMNYAGIVFNIPSSGLSALSSHRLQGISRSSHVIQLVVDVQRSMRSLPAPVRGMVLLLDSLETITDRQLQHLVRAPASCLMLNNLKYITTRQAEILAGFQGESICLNGLLWLSDNQARALARFKGSYLSLNSIHVLDVMTCKALCDFEGQRLFFKELDRLSVREFNKHRNSRTAQLVTVDE